MLQIDIEMTYWSRQEVEIHTLVYSNERAQECGTTYCSPPCTSKHVRRALEERMSLERDHWYEMQSTVDWKSPFEDCEEAWQWYVHA
jgi:hypothetical protein